MGAKKYVLFMISDKPIIAPPDTDGVQHLINEEVEVVPDDGLLSITKAVPHHMNSLWSTQNMYGNNACVSLAVVSWLDCIINCSGYVPFRDKPKAVYPLGKVK